MVSTNTTGENKNEGKKDTLHRKAYSAEIATYIKPMLKLKQQEDVIERGLTSAIVNMKIDSNILKDILQDHSEVSMKRQNFVDILYKGLHNIAVELKSIKYVMEDPEEMQKLDINLYKLRLIKLSQKMHDFKKSCSVQTLFDEQTVLESELNEFELNLRKHDDALKNTTPQFSRNKENKVEELDYKEIQDFHILVARTGHTENWSEEDHLLFLKMRNKCNSIPALVVAIQTKCPDLSIKTIVNHEAWYKLYLALREKQKSAVREWKKQKELEKAKKGRDNEKNIEEHLDYEKARNKTFKKDKTVVAEKTETSQAEIAHPSSSTESNRSEKKELIKNWKIEKEKKLSMDAEQVKKQMELKQEIEENNRRKRLKEIQEALCEYRRKKSLEAALKGSNENTNEKGKCNPTLIKAFRKQDEEYTKRRKDMILRFKKSNKSQTIEVKRPESTKMRNCSTLLNATKIWNEKRKIQNPIVKYSTELQYIKDVPRLCTRWRNEESRDLKNNLVFS